MVNIINWSKSNRTCSVGMISVHKLKYNTNDVP